MSFKFCSFFRKDHETKNNSKPNVRTESRKELVQGKLRFFSSDAQVAFVREREGCTRAILTVRAFFYLKAVDVDIMGFSFFSADMGLS